MAEFTVPIDKTSMAGFVPRMQVIQTSASNFIDLLTLLVSSIPDGYSAISFEYVFNAGNIDGCLICIKTS